MTARDGSPNLTWEICTKYSTRIDRISDAESPVKRGQKKMLEGKPKRKRRRRP